MAIPTFYDRNTKAKHFISFPLALVPSRISEEPESSKSWH